MAGKDRFPSDFVRGCSYITTTIHNKESKYGRNCKVQIVNPTNGWPENAACIYSVD